MRLQVDLASRRGDVGNLNNKFGMMTKMQLQTPCCCLEVVQIRSIEIFITSLFNISAKNGDYSQVIFEFWQRKLLSNCIHSIHS